MEAILFIHTRDGNGLNQDDHVRWQELIRLIQDTVQRVNQQIRFARKRRIRNIIGCFKEDKSGRHCFFHAILLNYGFTFGTVKFKMQIELLKRQLSINQGQKYIFGSHHHIDFLKSWNWGRFHREDIYEKREPWPKTGTPKIIDWAEKWQSAKETKLEKNDERGGKLKVVLGPKE